MQQWCTFASCCVESGPQVLRSMVLHVTKHLGQASNSQGSISVGVNYIKLLNSFLCFLCPEVVGQLYS